MEKPAYDGYDLLEKMPLLYKYAKENGVKCDDPNTWLDPRIHTDIIKFGVPTVPQGTIVNALQWMGIPINRAFKDLHFDSLRQCLNFTRFKASQVTILRGNEMLEETDHWITWKTKKKCHCLLFFHGGGLAFVHPGLYIHPLDQLRKTTNIDIYVLKIKNEFDLTCAINIDVIRNLISQYESCILMSDSSGASIIMYILRLNRLDNVYWNIKGILLLCPGFLELWKLSPSKLASVAHPEYSSAHFLKRQLTLYRVPKTELDYTPTLISLNILIIASPEDHHIDHSIFLYKTIGCKLLFGPLYHSRYGGWPGPAVNWVNNKATEFIKDALG